MLEIMRADDVIERAVICGRNKAYNFRRASDQIHMFDKGNPFVRYARICCDAFQEFFLIEDICHQTD